MKRLPSRVQVTCVSLRAQRGLDSAPVVLVIWRRDAGNRVNQDDVAAVYKEDAAARLVPAAAGRRRDVLRLVVGQLARRAAVAADDVGRGLVFGGLAPVEVELLGVGRTSAGRSADSRRGRSRA